MRANYHTKVFNSRPSLDQSIPHYAKSPRRFKKSLPVGVEPGAIRLRELAQKQGIQGPTKWDSVFGSMKGQLNEEFMEAIRELRSCQNHDK